MAKSQPSAFERVLPPRELVRGAAGGALGWSALGAVFLCLLLADVFLIVDLLVRHGVVEVGPNDLTDFARLTEEPIESAGATGLQLENRGVLPAVWWCRGTLWGDPLAALYRSCPPLRENSSALLTLVLAAFGLGLARSLLLSRVQTLSVRAAQQVATRLRRTIHRQTLRVGPSDLGDDDGSTAHALFTRDVEHVRAAVLAWIGRLWRSVADLCLLVLLALSIHWLVALQCLIPLLLCWGLLRRQAEHLAASRQLAAGRIDSELKLLGESFRKTRLVRGYGMEDFEHERFGHHLERYSARVLEWERGERWSEWLGRLLVLACIAIVLYPMAIKVLLPASDPGSLSFAAAATLLAAFACMHRPLEMLWSLRQDRRTASEAAERIYRYLNQIPEVAQAVGAKFLQPLSKSLQFEAVSYTLPNRRKLLDRFELKLPAGESAALISLDLREARAVAYLLPRFIEPQEGRILFDGEDIAWATLESLRAECVYVSGSDAYFTGTVRENISCGNPRSSLSEITEAAKLTHAHNFIVKLPQGYDTVLGEHGETLDAGESFRLALARAMLLDPALLIIEEPAEVLDEDTKSLLDDAYNRILADRTVLFLPTRLSTVRRADRIVLIHQGKVEAIGTHADLVKRAPLYRHWEYIRYNEFRHLTEAAT